LGVGRVVNDERKIRMRCPHCGGEFTGAACVLDKSIKCPQCGQRGLFSARPTEDEILADIAGRAMGGIRRAGSLAKGLLRKAATAGKRKYEQRITRAREMVDFERRLAEHLARGSAAGETLEQLVSESRELGVDLKDSVVSPRADLAAFYDREIERLRSGAVDDTQHENLLRRYFAAFGAEAATVSRLERVLAAVREARDIEAGRASPLTHVAGLVVRNSELVWFQASATTVTRNRREEDAHDGQLFVTNLRTVFTSRTAPNEVPMGALNAVEVEGDHLYLTGKTQSNSCEFWLDRAEVAAAHVRRAIRVFHRQVDVGFENGGSRHIPQDVKQLVWQRDGGKCVQCGAPDYLEFDHIIPVSKGGANTVPNVQLLCRRCNLKKADRV